MLYVRALYREAAVLLALLAAIPLTAGAENITLSPSEIRDIFLSPAEPVEPDYMTMSSSESRDMPMSPSEYRERARQSGQRLTMPVLKPGEYGTDRDNENNKNTHVADGDMDTYLYNTDSITPIEFNIILPATAAGKSGTLRMDVYDIDAASGEVDKVYVNNVQVGVLNGTTNKWGINIFAISPGILQAGRNLVRIAVDTANPGKGIWALTIDWGIIAVGGTSPTTLDITRCWIAPPRQKAGDYVNFFAEVNGVVDSVRVYVAGRTVSLTDPDRDKTWSNQWQIPTTVLPEATYPIPFYMVAIKSGQVVSLCPTLKVTR